MEFKKNKGTRKQEKTYGPMGLSEVRLRALMNEDEETYKFVREVCGPLVCFYEFLKSKGYTEDECYSTAKRLCMINLGRYMEEDTDYEEYIVETHYD